MRALHHVLIICEGVCCSGFSKCEFFAVPFPSVFLSRFYHDCFVTVGIFCFVLSQLLSSQECRRVCCFFSIPIANPQPQTLKPVSIKFQTQAKHFTTKGPYEMRTSMQMLDSIFFLLLLLLWAVKHSLSFTFAHLSALSCAARG